MTESAPARAGRRQWIGLAVLALPCVLYAMDLTVLNLAVPALSAALSPSSSELLWIVDIYGFMVAGWLITMGTLGDRIGRRRLLLLGAAAFGVVSVAAAFATSAPMLIAARAVLGVAGATLAPSTLSLIRNMFLDSRQRSVAIGVWITSYSVGGAIGPLVGGFLLEHYFWGSVFLVGVPVMALLLVLGPILLPEFRDPAARRLDVVSAALSLAAVLPPVYGLKRLAEHGLALGPVLTIVAGGVGAVLFVARQRRLADPMIDLGLFRSRSFSVALFAYGVGSFAAFGVFVFVAQYLQLVLGFTPLVAGLWTLPWMGGFVVGSNLAPWLTRRIGAPQLMTAGLVLAAVGYALLAHVDEHGSLALAVAGMTVTSTGLAPVFTLGTEMVVGAARPEHAGVAAAVSESSSELGGALGIAILGSVGMAVYRSGVEGGIGGRVTPEVLAAAQSTLGGASQLGPGVRAAADAAFIHGMAVVALVCGILTLATAAVVGTVLGRRSGRIQA